LLCNPITVFMVSLEDRFWKIQKGPVADTHFQPQFLLGRVLHGQNRLDRLVLVASGDQQTNERVFPSECC